MWALKTTPWAGNSRHFQHHFVPSSATFNLAGKYFILANSTSHYHMSCTLLCNKSLICTDFLKICSEDNIIITCRWLGEIPLFHHQDESPRDSFSVLLCSQVAERPCPHLQDFYFGELGFGNSKKLDWEIQGSWVASWVRNECMLSLCG